MSSFLILQKTASFSFLTSSTYFSALATIKSG